MVPDEKVTAPDYQQIVDWSEAPGRRDEFRGPTESETNLSNKVMRLQAKCNNQRRELRRLNKIQKAMWDGTRFELSCQMARRRQSIELAAYKIISFDHSDFDKDYQEAIAILKKELGLPR